MAGRIPIKIMDNSTTPVFKTAVSGFNKSDVNAYIAKLGRDFDEQKKELKKEIEDLKACLAENESKSALKAEASSANDDSLKAELERANELISALSKELEDAKLEAEILKGDLDNAQKELARFAQFEEKASQYETMSARMGEIFMEATADAERMRNEAKQTTETLVTDTENQCREKILLTEKKLDDFAEARKAEIGRLFDETQLKVNELLKECLDKSHALANDISSLGIDGISLSADDVDNS